ncbi:MAG: hypothetical protein JEZ00_08535 [Anaerolineaceae bacterium]|nr:hypothetical protein [Anaerolineaceae bacterium]
MMRIQHRSLLLFISLVSLMLLSACQGGQTQPTATPTTEVTIVPTQPPETPTATPQPERVVWVSSVQNEETQHLASTTQLLAEGMGVPFESMLSLDSNQISDAMKVVVVHSPNYDFSAAAASHPNTQFVVITNQALQPSENLTVIRSNPEHIYFAAGYLSMILSDDWRGVGMIASDTVLGDAAGMAYYNGGGYFCGRCSPIVPPYLQFPLVINLPANSPAALWNSSFEGIAENRLNIVFIDGSITDAGIYTMMADHGLMMLGSGNPPDAVRDRWAATISSDLSGTLSAIWPDIQAGNSVGEIYAQLELSNVNSNLAGDGVVQFFNAMAEELEMGLIATEYQSPN